MAIITTSVGALATLAGAAFGVIGTILYGNRKSKQDRLADARVKQFESIRDAALAVEKEYWELQLDVVKAASNSVDALATSQELQSLLLKYLTEVFFQCRRAELSIVDKEAGELLLAIERRSTIENIGSLAINDDVSLSLEVVLNYAEGSLNRFRTLTKLCRNRATVLDQNSSWGTATKPNYWSYADELEKKKRRDGGLFT